MSDRDVTVVLSNAPASVAETLARALVDARLVACVNLWPVTSVYRWQGAVTVDREVTMFCKTTRAEAPAVCAAIVAEHPYALPEVLALGTLEALSHRPYLQWVRDEVEPTQQPHEKKAP